MTIFAVGARVRLKEAADVFNLGLYPAGTAGTVIEADAQAVPGMYVAVIKLDDHFDTLDEWDNCLYVYRLADQVGEITEELFEPCGF
jgi:hypothetical protein